MPMPITATFVLSKAVHEALQLHPPECLLVPSYVLGTPHLVLRMCPALGGCDADALLLGGCNCGEDVPLLELLDLLFWNAPLVELK